MSDWIDPVNVPHYSDMDEAVRAEFDAEIEAINVAIRESDDEGDRLALNDLQSELLTAAGLILPRDVEADVAEILAHHQAEGLVEGGFETEE
jgi:hypothetical protein